MKKLLVVLFSLLIALALVGCTKAPEANNEEEVAEEATGKYTVYNMRLVMM